MESRSRTLMESNRFDDRNTLMRTPSPVPMSSPSPVGFPPAAGVVPVAAGSQAQRRSIAQRSVVNQPLNNNDPMGYAKADRMDRKREKRSCCCNCLHCFNIFLRILMGLLIFALATNAVIHALGGYYFWPDESVSKWVTYQLDAERKQDIHVR